MPPSPEKKPDPEVKGLDISKILLPKKESGPTPESAQRVNAGALLAQEENATLLKPTPPVVIGPTTQVPAPTTPAAPVEESETKPLQTYKADLDSVVAKQGVSAVSAAAAEAVRRGKQPLPEETYEEKKARSTRWAMIAGGVVLVLLAGVVLTVVLARPTSVPAAVAPQAPFIAVDDSKFVALPASPHTREELMTILQAARIQAKLSLGLIQWLYIAESPATKDGQYRPIGSAELLGTMVPEMPEKLLRVLSNQYLLGLHSFDENQPFLLLQVDSYETAYAGMLEWERTLQSDLSPLFTRIPSPQKTGATLPDESPLQFIRSNFLDRVVENRDARVVQNINGDILMLWTFLGRNTVLITTNEYTLREVLSRLNTTPVVPIPRQ